MGDIITFYSYKGGVGRSMALANVATLLARWGYDTLIVDWDLEAPGIENYFGSYFDVTHVKESKGIVDLLWEFKEETNNLKDSKIFSGMVNSIDIHNPKYDEPIDLRLSSRKGNIAGELSIISAGDQQDEYFKQVRDLDFESLYSEFNAGLFIEDLRNHWKDTYDFILIDSRTGITDIGGICTVQLPDVLVTLFTTNKQSFNGAVDVATKASTERQNLPFDRFDLVTVPIPSKFEITTEYRLSRSWLDLFSEGLTDIFSNWFPRDTDKFKFLEITKLPYIPFFSFGEKLPVIEEGTTDPSGLGYAYETLTALLANNLESIDILVEQRDQYINSSEERLLPVNKELIYICFDNTSNLDTSAAQVFFSYLFAAGLKPWSTELIPPGTLVDTEINKAIKKARASIILLSNTSVENPEFATHISKVVEQREKDPNLLIIPASLNENVLNSTNLLEVKKLTRFKGLDFSHNDPKDITQAVEAFVETLRAQFS